MTKMIQRVEVGAAANVRDGEEPSGDHRSNKETDDNEPPSRNGQSMGNESANPITEAVINHYCNYFQNNFSVLYFKLKLLKQLWESEVRYLVRPASSTVVTKIWSFTLLPCVLPCPIHLPSYCKWLKWTPPTEYLTPAMFQKKKKNGRITEIRGGLWNEKRNHKKTFRIFIFIINNSFFTVWSRRTRI